MLNFSRSLTNEHGESLRRVRRRFGAAESASAVRQDVVPADAAHAVAVGHAARFVSSVKYLALFIHLRPAAREALARRYAHDARDDARRDVDDA